MNAQDMFCVVDKIKANVGALDILNLAWTRLSPKWVTHTNNFPLSSTDCQLFTKDWVEIVPRTPDVNVIADRFYKPNAKSPHQPHFKTAKMLINLCIPFDIYQRWEEYDAQQQINQLSDRDSDSKSVESEDQSIAVVSRTTIQTRSRAQKPRSKLAKNQPLFLGGLNAASSSTSPTSPTTSLLKPASFSSIQKTGKENSARRREDNLDSSYFNQHGSEPEGSMIAPSGSSSRVVTSLSKQAFIKALAQQKPPSRQEVSGLMNLTSIPVQASIANQLTLAELLCTSETVGSLLHSPVDVVLSLNLTPRAQKRGGFKIASFGRSSKALFGGSSTNICGKRTFYSEKDDGGVVHYLPCPSSQQAQDLVVELRCSVWSAALLTDPYEGVDNFIAGADTQPPIEVPRLRFVQVAFAKDGKTVEPGRTRSVFLVEEYIDEAVEGQFRKYINNRAPVPTSFVQHTDNHNRALFLAFTQHWQYRRTHGLAFVSDYQGGNTLLTDPQVMSDESLGDIFGSGNIPTASSDFPRTHLCNIFCEYFKISENFDSMDEDLPMPMSISRSARPIPHSKQT
ncbi:hypothetical protein R3P38DRAFT_2787454 [Favolaschia claudopus]|uniref:Alpha-type protein kinase domain-containing protein n=1 Tax=Favolaschia claudopus TaxID=2862362 RepID=A0AAW0AP20_9AGAR